MPTSESVGSLLPQYRSSETLGLNSDQEAWRQVSLPAEPSHQLHSPISQRGRGKEKQTNLALLFTSLACKEAPVHLFSDYGPLRLEGIINESKVWRQEERSVVFCDFHSTQWLLGNESSTWPPAPRTASHVTPFTFFTCEGFHLSLLYPSCSTIKVCICQDEGGWGIPLWPAHHNL